MLPHFALPDAAASSDPRFREIFDYWLAKAPPDRLPGRQHLDPGELRHLLPGVVLYDVVRTPQGLRFRWRLVGTAVVEAVGSDHTGKFLDEVILEPDRRRALHAGLSAAVQTRQPQFWRTPLSFPGRDFVWLERLALPLASDGEAIDVVLAYYVTIRAPDPAARPI